MISFTEKQAEVTENVPTSTIKMAGMSKNTRTLPPILMATYITKSADDIPIKVDKSSDLNGLRVCDE